MGRHPRGFRDRAVPVARAQDGGEHTEPQSVHRRFRHRRDPRGLGLCGYSVRPRCQGQVRKGRIHGRQERKGGRAHHQGAPDVPGVQAEELYRIVLRVHRGDSQPQRRRVHTHRREGGPEEVPSYHLRRAQPRLYCFRRESRESVLRRQEAETRGSSPLLSVFCR